MLQTSFNATVSIYELLHCVCLQRHLVRNLCIYSFEYAQVFIVAILVMVISLNPLHEYTFHFLAGQCCIQISDAFVTCEKAEKQDVAEIIAKPTHHYVGEGCG